MKSKYSNVRTHGFHSKKESNRFDDLVLLQRAGEIYDLKTQVRYTFDQLSYPSGRHPSYIADFVYRDKNGKQIIEDTKGYRTGIYKLKYALMQHFFNLTVLET